MCVRSDAPRFGSRAFGTGIEIGPLWPAPWIPDSVAGSVRQDSMFRARGQSGSNHRAGCLLAIRERWVAFIARPTMDSGRIAGCSVKAPLESDRSRWCGIETRPHSQRTARLPRRDLGVTMACMGRSRENTAVVAIVGPLFIDTPQGCHGALLSIWRETTEAKGGDAASLRKAASITERRAKFKNVGIPPAGVSFTLLASEVERMPETVEMLKKEML